MPGQRGAAALEPLSTFQHGCIGAAVGSIEQSVMRPTVFWKAMLQQDRFVWSRAVNPVYLYRGLPVAVLSIAPITCIQFACNHVCNNAMHAFRGPNKSNNFDALFSGCMAGLASAIVQSPFQLVEVNQQNCGGNMLVTARRVHASFGIAGFFRGLSMTGTREGFFCASYLAVAPAAKQGLLAARPGLPDQAATAASSVLAGVSGAVLSHPADTIKTCLQGSLFQAAPGSAGASAFHAANGPMEALAVMRKQGPLISRLYSGFTPRAFRLVWCLYIYSNLTEVFEAMARDWKHTAELEVPLALAGTGAAAHGV